MPSKKIISLLPAATETVCALGLENQLAGRSSECDFPASVTALPVCSALRFGAELTSAEIDSQIRELRANAASLYQLDLPLMKSIKPDLVIAGDGHDILSLNKEMDELTPDETKGLEVIFLHPASMEDVFNDIMRIGAKAGVTSSAEALINELKERRDIIRHKLKFVEDRPSVVQVEWLSPLKMGKGIAGELIEVAGGRPLLMSGDLGHVVDFEELKNTDPEVLIIAPRGFSIGRTIGEINLLIGAEGWQDLSAVKNNKVFIADGKRYFNNAGPAMIDTLEILAEIIQPKQFMFGYEGEAWVKFGV